MDRLVEVKAPWPMVVTESGMVIEVRLEPWVKEPDSMVIIESGIV